MMKTSSACSRTLIAIGALMLVLAAATVQAGQRRGTRRVGECAGFRLPDGPEWAAWAELAQQAVRKAWQPPVSARKGASGLVLLHARVRPDGLVHDVGVIKERATPGMLAAARNALATASPLPPLPPRPDEPRDEGITLSYLFAYNVSDEATCRFRDRWRR